MYWIKIEEQNTGKIIWETELDKQFTVKKRYKNGQLKPKETYIFHLASREELSQIWEPEDGNDIVLLQIDINPHDQFFKIPNGYKYYALKIRFQVDNDGIFTKIIRWRFRRYFKGPDGKLSENSPGELLVWRIPLAVKPKFSKILSFSLSFSTAVVISEIYEYFFSSSWRETSFWDLLKNADFLYQHLLGFVALSLLTLLFLFILNTVQRE